MASETGLVASVGSGMAQFSDRVLDYLPNLLAALALLAVGWLVARLLKALTKHTILGLDWLWHRAILRSGLPKTKLHQPTADVVSGIVFWLVILFFVTAATEALHLVVFTDWLSRVVAYLPTLLAGALIVLAGYLGSVLVRDLLVTASESAGLTQATLLGRIAQALVLGTAIVVGADQIGINVTFLVTISGVILGALFGGLALAFGFGGQHYVRNLIARRSIQQRVQPGDRVQVAGHEGVVVEITATAVILDAGNGRVAIPNQLFEETPSVVLDAGARDEQ